MKRLDIKKAVKLFNDGYTIDEIVEEVGASNKEYLKSKMRAAGVVFDAPEIDVGKVWALHLAGWSSADICEEFGEDVTPEYIDEIISRK